jgi:hypothetical protein
MRRLLLSFFLIISFNSSQAQEFVNTLLEDDFSPKQDIIATLLHESFSPNKFIQINKIQHQETWQYKENKNGHTDSVLLETIDYQYNNIGQIAQEEKNNKLNFSTYKYLYSYNQQGLPEKKTDYAYFHDKLPIKDYITITEFAYDNLGQITLNITYGADSIFHYSQKREYDSNGNILKITRNSENKFLYTTHVFHYSKDGDLEKLDFIAPDKHINYSYILKIDTANDKKIITVLRDSKPFLMYKYNSIQQRLQTVNYDYKGDDPRDLLTKIIYNPNGTVNTKLFYMNSELQTVHKFFYK